VDGTKSIIDALAKGAQCDEGLGAIATSKLSDVLLGSLLRARPLVILFDPRSEQTVSFRIRRCFRTSKLLVAVNDGVDREISSSTSAGRLLIRLVSKVAELKSKGFVEI
jgi:hypothetical protein